MKKRICIEIRCNYPVPQGFGTIHGDEIVEIKNDYDQYAIRDDGVTICFLEKTGKLIKNDFSTETTDYYEYFIN